LRIDQALLGGIGSIVVFGAISIAFVTARVQLQDEIDRERNIVETLQGAFRDDPDVLPGARIGTAYLSAERDGAVGGDLYDVRRLDERRGLVLIADVSGKGIPAAVNTAFVRYSIGALARQTDDPAVVLAEFNRMFLASVSDPNLFVVVFAGMLDGAGMTLRYASAGHSGAFLRRHGDVTQLAVTGPMIGLDATFAFESRTVALEAGDTIVLATDGLSEARDRDGAFLGDEGAMAFLAASTETSPERLAGDLVAHVRGRSDGRLADDLALLVLAIDGVS
jgi:sigma-B regulation protein RsbU (phosphoserine phosphatase)